MERGAASDQDDPPAACFGLAGTESSASKMLSPELESTGWQ